MEFINKICQYAIFESPANLQINGKSTGVDGVSIRLLKSGTAVLSQHLSHILNLSLKTGEIPECWKYTRIVPIYKGTGSEMDCGIYRPISIQPIPLTVLKQVVNEQL